MLPDDPNVKTSLLYRLMAIRGSVGGLQQASTNTRKESDTMRIILDTDKLPQGGYKADIKVSAKPGAVEEELPTVYAEKPDSLAHRIDQAIRPAIKAL
jgi:hypothetical protein